MNYLIRFALVNRSIFCLILVFLAVNTAMSQDISIPGKKQGSAIIDDSTKQIYGPNTINTFREDKLRFNLTTKSTVDTSEYNFHLTFFDMERANYEAQDLGNMGSMIFQIALI